MPLRIVSNNQPRDLLKWWDLSEAERAEFDYLDTEDARQDASFARYRGAVYDLNEFMCADASEFVGWDGYTSDTFFSGVLARFVDHGEAVIMARFYS